MTTLTAYTIADIDAAQGPGPYLAREGEPRFHLEKTAGQAALAIDPHNRSPRLEHTIVWLLGHEPRTGRPLFPDTELLRHTHQVLHPDLGTLAGLMSHEALPLMAKLDSIYRKRPMDLQDVRNWHTDFLAVSPFPVSNHETAGAVLAALSFPPLNRFLVPGQ